MLRQKFTVVSLLVTLLLPGLVFGQTPNTPNNEAINKMIEEGTKRSEAMKTLRYLTDVIGARLTNSPAQKRANNWTRDKLTEWGIQNATVDPWGTFGRGWTLKKYEASLVEPEQVPFHSYPKAWSPSTMVEVAQQPNGKGKSKKNAQPTMTMTEGAVTGDVVYMDVKTEADLEKYKGKLKGAIVFTNSIREIKPGFDSVASRLDEKELLALANATESPQGQGGFRFTPEMQAAFTLNNKKIQMCYDEGAAVLVEASQLDSGTIRVMGASLPPSTTPPTPGQPNPNAPRVFSKDAPKIIPQIVAAVEHYNRVARLVQQGEKVRMTVDLRAQFNEDDLQGYNTIAEIPGTDLKDEIVMVGAHLDSWHSGTGATDNGTGVTVAMEALRIIQASGLKPRRTIRIGLWTGEEQGLLGSRGYVAKNFAEVSGQGANRTVQTKPDHDKFSAYYNLDNGTGQIRGINLQGNEQLRSIFRPWLQSFRDWNSTTISVQSVGGTDHLAFDAVGLPGFQFIQDPIEYGGRTWHTTQDVSDRVIEEDLKRSSVIMAAFAYQTAMADGKLPRKSQGNVNRLALGFDRETLLEEAAFRRSGLNFSVCGHPFEDETMHEFFPLHLTVGHNSTLAE